VHMAWLGHPIVGDKVYGPDETLYLQFIEKGVTNEMLEKLLLPRHALHAESVTFRHPRTNEPCEFRAELPDDMREFIAGHG
jgi:23S rRNA pseudouridine1911/1915/1917 synthase